MNYDLTGYVNPFIGTGDFGHTFPGATYPFGMVQLSPDIGNTDWNLCSGYYYPDSTIMGFSHMHLSGTGVPDLGDFPISPYIGEILFEPGDKDIPDSGYRSRFSHKNEAASPGYYSVILKDYQIKAEMTVSQRAGFHKYTFPQNDHSHILINFEQTLNNPVASNKILAAHFDILNDTLITGFHQSQGWTRDRKTFFAAIFSKPMLKSTAYIDGKIYKNKRKGDGTDIKLIVHTKTVEREQILIKVGISAVSVEGALNNVNSEIPHWKFDQVRASAKNAWNNELNKVKIDADSEAKRIFYTSLYHAFIAPSLYMDVDRKYRGADNKIYNAERFTNYHIFSLWDTFRALHPLFTILQPDRVDDFVNSMLAHYKQYEPHILPIWSLGNNETFCMIGNHAVPVIVDTYLKGHRGFDANLAYEAIKASLTKSHFNSNWERYKKFGYLPFDLEKTESVSNTLEFCFDDWCAAQMAKKLNNDMDCQYFTERSNYYKSLFDKNRNFMIARDTNGNWIEPFHPLKISHAASAGGEYTEANAWQYLWYVPHNIQGLVELFGGKATFVQKLDSLFNIESVKIADGLSLDVSGLIGQYAHGNEPCHHVAYLYNFVDQPWKTQEKVTEIMKTMYKAEPDGLCGNDDCGQMSAWYIFSAMGFYPVNPANGEYAIGRPFFKEIDIALPLGKNLKILAHNLSDQNIYVKSVKLNGVVLTEPFIHHNQIIQGGILEFDMSPTY